MAVYLKNPEESTEKLLQTKREFRDFPSGPVANAGGLQGDLCAPDAGGWGLISGQGTRSHILQLRAGCSQQKLFLKENSVISCGIKLINRNSYVQKVWKIWRARIKIS